MTACNSAALREQKALERYRFIAPLLDEDLDSAKKTRLRERIARENDLTGRTLYRYEKAFRERGFEGLKPVERTGANKAKNGSIPNFSELVQEAIQLRKEVPERSVEQIIFILESEGRVAPGVLKRSTLQRHLQNAGFSSCQLRVYKEAVNSSQKRFCKPHRMMLVQGDIKYGPVLKDKKGKKFSTYLSTVLDDHSRMVLSSRFYDNQEAAIVEDTFRTAVTKYGRFDACYLDNGKQYISEQLRITLSRLGIRIMHAPVRSGKSKGKIEKFHQVVDKFLLECKAQKIDSLDELNRMWAIYLEEAYQKKKHEGIAEYYESRGIGIPKEGISPLQEFNRDSRPLTYLDVSVIAEAFLHHENRMVNRGACFSFQGRQYEVNPSLIGFKVEIAYDPMKPETVTVSYPGMEPFTAKPLEIGEFCSKKQDLPVSILQNGPESSRLLAALEKQNEKCRERNANAISFSSYRKEGSGNV